MPYHKTKESERTKYVYAFGKNGCQKIVLLPGKDGVTEVDIKRLHSWDDYEVDRNYANWKVPRTKEEKKVIKTWTEEYSRLFEDRFGYEPCKADLKAAVEDKFPPNWHISIDEAEERYKDKFEMRLDEAATREETFRKAIHDRIIELLEGLTDREKEIYRLVVTEEMKMKEAAAVLGISDSYVSRVMKKIRAILESDKFLRKNYGLGSDFDEVNRHETWEDTDES